MSRLGNSYAFMTPEYILRRMTWAQVWLYYEACIAHKGDKVFDSEETSKEEQEARLYPGMAGVTRDSNGALTYGK